MRRATSLIAALIFGATSCTLIADIHEGKPRVEMGCSSVGDCVVEVPECRTAVACKDGTCVYDDAIEGTPLQAQTPGDCAEVVCDGAGKTKLVPSETDAPDDGKVCTIDTCNGTTPVHTLMASVPCYSGPTGTEGVGVCKGGMQQCGADGNPTGACIGEVVPSAETCDAAKQDEDCDGQVNEEGANCVCGDGFLSAGEECDDGNAVDGDSCSSNCKKESAIPVAYSGRTCALLYDGNVKCWGNALNGPALGFDMSVQSWGGQPNQMGDKLPMVDLVPVKSTIGLSVSLGGCALLNDGGVKCWGLNSFGQLGLGDTTNRGDSASLMGNNLPYVYLGVSAKATAVASGLHHSCAVLEGGALKCWGRNQVGQLGQGNTENVGDGATEMGLLMPIDLGSGKKAIAVAAGDSHTCALLDDGTVKCWGYNADGQLGLGDTATRGDMPGQMGDNLPTVDLGTGKKAKALFAGGSTTCALLTDGGVKCWGGNAFGGLGLGDANARGDAPGEMGDSLPLIDLGAGKTATALALGDYHVCAVLNDGSVKCWGYNSVGQLGHGDTMSRGDMPGQMGDNLLAVDLGTGRTATSITAGQYHSCAGLDNGAIKCWGDNSSGQLGLGDMTARGDNPGEMGDDLPTVKLFSNVW